MTGARPLAAAAACGALLLTACESTQDKSARLEKEGKAVLKEEGLRITERSTSVDVKETTLLQDANGAAVVVEVKSTSDRALTNVPIAVDVTDKAGKSVYKNDVPGLEPSLTSVPVLQPKEEFAWVNDQLTALGGSGQVGKAEATIGAQKDATAAKEIPEITVGPAALRDDPVSGIEAVGYVHNKSKTEQRNIFIHCVGRKGGKIVAAGRSRIERIKPGRRGRYHVFFIGNPRGAKLEVKAPPVALEPQT